MGIQVTYLMRGEKSSK